MKLVSFWLLFLLIISLYSCISSSKSCKAKWNHSLNHDEVSAARDNDRYYLYFGLQDGSGNRYNTSVTDMDGATIQNCPEEFQQYYHHCYKPVLKTVSEGVKEWRFESCTESMTFYPWLHMENTCFVAPEEYKWKDKCELKIGALSGALDANTKLINIHSLRNDADYKNMINGMANRAASSDENKYLFSLSGLKERPIWFTAEEAVEAHPDYQGVSKNDISVLSETNGPCYNLIGDPAFEEDDEDPAYIEVQYCDAQNARIDPTTNAVYTDCSTNGVIYIDNSYTVEESSPSKDIEKGRQVLFAANIAPFDKEIADLYGYYLILKNTSTNSVADYVKIGLKQKGVRYYSFKNKETRNLISGVIMDFSNASTTEGINQYKVMIVTGFNPLTSGYISELPNAYYDIKVKSTQTEILSDGRTQESNVREMNIVGVNNNPSLYFGTLLGNEDKTKEKMEKAFNDDGKDKTYFDAHIKVNLESTQLPDDVMDSDGNMLIDICFALETFNNNVTDDKFEQVMLAHWRAYAILALHNPNNTSGRIIKFNNVYRAFDPQLLENTVHHNKAFIIIPNGFKIVDNYGYLDQPSLALSAPQKEARISGWNSAGIDFFNIVPNQAEVLSLGETYKRMTFTNNYDPFNSFARNFTPLSIIFTKVRFDQNYWNDTGIDAVCYQTGFASPVKKYDPTWTSNYTKPNFGHQIAFKTGCHELMHAWSNKTSLSSSFLTSTQRHNKVCDGWVKDEYSDASYKEKISGNYNFCIFRYYEGGSADWCFGLGEYLFNQIASFNICNRHKQILMNRLSMQEGN